MIFFDIIERFFDIRQGDETQKVHFQKPEMFDFNHIELGDDFVAVSCKWNIGVDGFWRDQHSCRVHAAVSRHALHLYRHIHHFSDQLVILISLFQLRYDKLFIFWIFLSPKIIFQNRLVLFEAVWREVWDLFCQSVDIRKRHPEHSADISYRVFCFHAAESHYAGNMIGAIFSFNVFDNLSAPILAEIDVEVGHRNAFWVDEPFKEEVIFDRIDLGYAYAVSDQTACT